MKDSAQNLRSRPLEEEIAATKESLGELESTHALQVEEFARLRAWVDQTEQKINNQQKLEESVSITEDITSGSPSFGYGTQMIGRTVIEAARYCNRLTGDGSNPPAKELVNLILGKTEVVKAEMLQIILSQKNAEEKKAAIDAQFEQAKDYFESVMRQIK